MLPRSASRALRIGCLGTAGKRVGFFKATGIPDADHINVTVTVWQLP